MFTGIVQAVGTVAALELNSGRRAGRIEIRGAEKVLKRARIGSSLAVNGCCLTITAKRAGGFGADLSAQTLTLTALGRLRPGGRVNLEPPLRLGDELGGHMLQGHVEGVGELLELAPESPGANGWLMRVSVPVELERYLVPQGTLGVEGISLTIAGLEPGAVRFAIIPHTYRHTNLRFLRPGAPLNLETDPLARHLERLLEAREAARAKPALSVAELRRQGF